MSVDHVLIAVFLIWLGVEFARYLAGDARVFARSGVRVNPLCKLGLHKPGAVAFIWRNVVKHKLDGTAVERSPQRGDLPAAVTMCERCSHRWELRGHPALHHPALRAERLDWERRDRQAGPHRGAYPGCWFGLDGNGDVEQFGPLVPPRGPSAVG